MQDKLQALVSDILLWRRVPESDARSVRAGMSICVRRTAVSFA